MAVPAAFLLIVLCVAPRLVAAQSLDSLVLRLAAWSAVTGYEDAAADSLLALLPEARLDRAGNVVATLGEDDPLRVAVCPLDEPGYVVGGVTPEGYLTLRRVGPASGPLHDQLWLEARRVTLFGRDGPVEGIVGTRSIHIQPAAPDSQPPLPLAEAFVDVGVRSPAGVDELGIGVLTPVALRKQPHRYGAAGDLLAAPAVASRAACAAMVHAAGVLGASRQSGTAVLVFARRSRLGHAGEAAALRELGIAAPVAGVVVLRAPAAEATPGAGTFQQEAPAAGLGAAPARQWALPARHLGTPVETVSLRDVAALADALAAFLAGGP